MDQGNSLLFTYRIPDSGSTAAPPHSPPPSKPGKIQEPSLLGGVKGALYLIFLYFSIISAWASGLTSVISPESNCWRAKGSGSEGMGWVGQGSSPGRAFKGTG